MSKEFEFKLEVDDALQRELEIEQRLEKIVEERTKELQAQVVELKNQINSLRMSLQLTVRGGMVTLNYARRIEQHVEKHLGPLPEPPKLTGPE